MKTETKARGLLERGIFVMSRKSLTGLVVLCSGEEGAVYFIVVVFSLCHFKADLSPAWQSIGDLKQLPEAWHCLLLSIHSTLSLLSPFIFLSFSLLFDFVFISSSHFLDGEGALSLRGFAISAAKETNSLS